MADPIPSDRARDRLPDVTAVLQMLPDGVLLGDRRGIITCSNSAAERLFGFGPGELAGHRITEVLPDRSDAALPAASQPAPHRAWWRWVGRRKDGSDVEVEVIIHVLREGGDQFVIAVRDARALDEEEIRRVIGHLEQKVEERTQQLRDANQALERQTHRTELILEAAGEGIFGVDGEGRVTFVNAAGSKMLGWDAGELVGANPHERFHLARADGTAYGPGQSWVLEAIADGQVHTCDTEHFFRTDGRRFPVEIVASPAGGAGAAAGAVVVFRDITERRRAEGERERRFQLMQRLIDASPLATVLSGASDGRVLKVNAKFRELFGWAAEELPDVEAWRAVAYPDARDRDAARARWEELLAQVAAGDAIAPFDTTVACKDHSLRSITVHGALIGNLLHLVMVDNTERNWALETIRASERRLSLLVQQSPLGVIEWNRWGEVVAWNPAVARIFGYTAQEVMGCHFSLLVPEERRLNPNHRWEQLLAGEYGAHVVWEGVTKDGRVVTCEWHNSRLVDDAGQFVGVASLVLDVTEQKRADRERRRLWQAVEQSPSTVVITDTAGIMQYVNPMFERTTGYTAAEALGQKASLLRSGQHDHAFYADLWDTLQQGDTWRGELCNRKKSGELYWETVTISPARSEEGEITHYIALKEDITVRKQWEEALERAKEQAEAASRAKSAFLASMSHEIRTPLNAILGYSQVTVRDAGLSPQARRNLEVINRSGEHLLALVNDVLEMSKIEAGRATVEPITFDLHALLVDLEAMFALRARTHGLRFEVTRAPGVPRFVEADQGKVRQVLVNLLGNAVKFTSQGGVTLLVTAAHAGADPLRLRVDVADTGVGIAPEELPRLFRDFEQAEAGRRQQSGTGLGLAISRGYARLMGGDVTVVSTPGEGSTFSLELPVREVPALERAGGASARRVLGLRGGGAPPRILIADDEETNRDWLRQVLQAIGFEVREAASGREAVELWRAWRPACVLMDVRMPELDGVGATRAIRAAPGGEAAHVVAVTATGFEEERRAVLEAGAEAVVPKPVRESELLETMRRLLGLDYAYEEAPAGGAAHAAAEPLTPEALAPIGGEILLALQEALRRGDVDELHRLVAEAGRAAPPAAAQLGALVDGFAYERLQVVLADGLAARRGQRT